LSPGPELPFEFIGIIFAEVEVGSTGMSGSPLLAQSGSFEACLKCRTVGKELLFACIRIDVRDGRDDRFGASAAVLRHEIKVLHLGQMPWHG
jgi:hypothetical protein